MQASQKIKFRNVQDQRIKSLFNETLRHFQFPEHINIILEGTHLKGSTMQAQPVIGFDSFFNGIDTYRIRLAEFVRDSSNIRVDGLSEDILVGWFAHELGHVVDYMNRPAIDMLGFGIRYITSGDFRREAERRADEIAMAQGFHDQIIATKEFLFNHDLIHESYRNKLKRYYMSIEDARSFIAREVLIDPVV